MKNTSRTLAFFGNERLSSSRSKTGLPVLNGLLTAGHEVEAILIPYARATSRKKVVNEVEEFAETKGIKLIEVESKQHLADVVKDLNSEVAVLAAFGMIIPESVIDHFKYGILNIHPSLLPRHRGPTPIESTILSGDKVAGVSLMSLDVGMDTGPVISFSELTKAEGISKDELTASLAQMGLNLLLEAISSLGQSPLMMTEQELLNGDVSYTKKIAKDDGEITPEHTTEEALAMIIAYADWPTTYAYHNEKKLIILEAEITDPEINSEIEVVEKKLVLRLADGCIEITKLKPENRNAMDAASYINGLN